MPSPQSRSRSLPRSAATLIAIFATPLSLSGAAIAAAAHARADAASATIRLKDIAYHPGRVTVRRGERVTWLWQDAAINTEHSVTSNGPTRFPSSPRKFDGAYTVRFSRPGTYRFHCTVHPLSMRGVVVVR